MKIFCGVYSVNTACNCHPEYDDRCRFVVALTKQQALGYILEYDANTEASDWSIQEIPTDKPGLFDEDGDLLKPFD